MFITLSQDQRWMKTYKASEQKNKTKNTKTVKTHTHTHTHTHLRLSIFSFFLHEVKSSVVVVSLLNQFSDTRSFFPVSLPKYISEKIAAAFLLPAKQPNKKRRYFMGLGCDKMAQ